MKRRSGAGAVKSRRRRVAVSKPPSGSESARTQPNPERDAGKLSRELAEARQEQTATADVLRIIGSSSAGLDHIFKTLLENAARICDAQFGLIFQYDGEAFIFAAGVGTSRAFEQFLRRRGPFQPEPNTHLGRVKRTRQVSHTADYAAESAPDHPPVKLGGARSTLDVPMLKADQLIGAFSIYRQEVRPFTERQIELVKNFAAQAVVAIENARLLNELRQRTDDLSEALEQQTATSQVLQVINSSPGDLQPVFAAMLEKAVRICDAKFGNIYRWDGEVLHLMAGFNTPQALVDARKRAPIRVRDNALIARMIEAKAAVQLADLTATPGYLDRTDIGAVAAVELGGARTGMVVPMLRERELIGSFTLLRGEVRPFSDSRLN